jgi:hypothetical protein
MFATSLILLSLLTLFSVAMYFAGRSAIQTSSSAQRSTEGYYYTETAVQYMAWALRNDAEFNGFDFRGPPVNDVNAVDPAIFPALAANASTVGDWIELSSHMWEPGPTVISDSLAAGISGQVMYFDNSPMSSRYVCLQDASIFSNCIDVTLDPSDPNYVEPVMCYISTKLPRYIKLEISAAGVVTPSIPTLPHADPPVVGVDIPDNGAVVWITAASIINVNHDQEFSRSSLPVYMVARRSQHVPVAHCLHVPVMWQMQVMRRLRPAMRTQVYGSPVTV